jgi:hypothetical protein
MTTPLALPPSLVLPPEILPLTTPLALSASLALPPELLPLPLHLQ